MNRPHQHDNRMMKLLQDQLGRNVDADLMSEVAEHMEECPDCHIYVDSVHQTINLIKTIDANNSLPIDVKNRIYKTLKLEIEL